MKAMILSSHHANKTNMTILTDFAQSLYDNWRNVTMTRRRQMLGVRLVKGGVEGEAYEERCGR